MNKSRRIIVFILVALFTLLLGIIPFSHSGFSQAITEGSQAKVIVSKCNLYTEANFTSEKVTYIEGENTILVVLNHGDNVTIKSLNGDFAYITTEDEKEGYIYKYYITDNNSQAVYPVFNASIRKDTKIYDIDKNATEYTAKKDTRVYLYKGFNDKEKYTAVQIVLEDESLYNGYIKTEDIKPDGVSGLLVAAITIIIAGVTIVLSLVFIKKKKKKKKA